MPLFFEETTDFFEYLPDSASLIMVDGAREALQAFEANTAARYEQRRHDVERPILAPDELYLGSDEVQTQLSSRALVSTQRYEIENPGDSAINLPTEAPGLFPIEPRGERPMGTLIDFLGKFPGRALFVAESTGRREALLDQLVGNRLKPETVDSWQAFLDSDRALCLTTAAIDRGLQLPASQIVMITENQLGSGRIKRRERKRATRLSLIHI